MKCAVCGHDMACTGSSELVCLNCTEIPPLPPASERRYYKVTGKLPWRFAEPTDIQSVGCSLKETRPGLFYGRMLEPFAQILCKIIMVKNVKVLLVGGIGGWERALEDVVVEPMLDKRAVSP